MPGTFNNPYTPIQVATNVDMSLTGYASPTVEKLSYPNINLHVYWAGSPVGVWGLQVSNVSPTGPWVTLTLPMATQPSGSSGQFDLDVECSAQYMQFIYTKTSGTGTLNAFLVGTTS